MLQLSDLIYYPDSRPGITRRRQGRGFSYIAPDGTRIDAAAERRRLAALAVPPAYEEVWISPEPLGHLQATGRDARRRKQYRYHPDWRAWRERHKYDQLAGFGAALPALRRRILRDLRTHKAGDAEFATAAILALIDRAAMRVGSPDYTRENQTYGATTLRSRHMQFDGDTLVLRYRGKGGDRIAKRLRDATLNRILHRLDDLPGPQLVSWTDEGGSARSVTSEMVNATLAEATGETGLTAKTFRTWNGSAAAMAVAARPGPLTIKAMAEAAAERLHNTATIARNSYIHPGIIALTDTPEPERLARLEDAPERRGLRRAEAQLLHMLSNSD